MKRLLAATAFSLIAASCPVYAQSAVELTLEQYIAMGNASGGTITFASKDSGADYVEYKDVKIAAPDGSFTLETAFLRATEVSGMTALTFAPAINISMVPDGAAAATSFVVSSSNLKLTTNTIVADPSTLSSVHVDLAADALKIGDLGGDMTVLKALNFEQTSPVISFDLDLATMKAKGGWTTPSLAMVYDFVDAGATQKADSKMTAFDLSFDMDVPQGEMDMPAFLSGQKNLLVKMSTGGSEGSGSMSQPEMAIDYVGKAGPSTMEVSMTGGNVLLNVKGTDAAYTITPTSLGMPPVDLSIKETLMNIVIPFSATTAPGEANIALKFGDLVLGETGWAMIDPGAALPHDPLNVDIDISANVQFAPDVMMAGMMDPMSAAKFTDAKINSFLISAAGAKVTATGGVTFDPSIPVPAPTGIITVGIEGVTTLAQALSDLGMIPPDQVAMVGAMLGMYAKPTGADAFTTDVEFKGMEPPTINGQPLPQ